MFVITTTQDVKTNAVRTGLEAEVAVFSSAFVTVTKLDTQIWKLNFSWSSGGFDIEGTTTTTTTTAQRRVFSSNPGASLLFLRVFFLNSFG